MKSLYCFKLEEDYSITVYEITEYTKKHNFHRTRTWYKWETPKINKSERYFEICGERLDKFTCNKVYSFNPDIEQAKKIIFNSMTDRIEQARNEMKKWDNRRDQFYLKNMSDYEEHFWKYKLGKTRHSRLTYAYNSPKHLYSYLREWRFYIKGAICKQ